ncbi:MAG TPA: polysaccharide biosynthesis/export family protein [Allosphingosinicella sp.]|nr:polysaccharide biosynthesis/export family protein [Allosphingosinicella sp.]
MLALGGCGAGGRGGSVPYEPANFGAPDAEAVAVPPSQQRLSPLDKIRVTVFQVADLSGEFQVDAAGNIQFPLIGTVAAQGKTPIELKNEITRLLSARYLNQPDVQVAVTEQSEQTITVDGAVRQPGVVPIRGATTLMRAVALARGTSEDANPSRVLVFRTINGERMAAAFDLQSIRRAESEDPPIYGNDIVVVDGSNTRRMWRDIISTLPVLGMFRPF